MSLWVDHLDSSGRLDTSIHRDGHKIGLFPGGEWWAYHKDYRYTPPREPNIGPDPAGPFLTAHEAKSFVESQGWACNLPFENAPQTLGERQCPNPLSLSA